MIRRNDALDYHRSGRPGKIEVVPTKPLVTQRDLSLAYSPGVAEPCLEIADDPGAGLGVHGARQPGRRRHQRHRRARPRQHRPARRQAGDGGQGLPLQEVRRHRRLRPRGRRARRRQRSSTSVAALEPTFGGINLEDIKAPECFEIEAGLRDAHEIPVFHDDQHGTAIISGAALLNAPSSRARSSADMKVVVSGAGAAAIACANFYVAARRAARERHAGRLARASSTRAAPRA